MAKEKLDFKHVIYDGSTIRWGRGNNVIGLQLLARMQTREPTTEEEKAEHKDWLSAKKIYDEHINLGQKFIPSGEDAHRGVVAKITYIHNEKQLITWRQCNLTDEQKANGNKPAAGKWDINSMLSLHRGKQISFIK